MKNALKLIAFLACFFLSQFCSAQVVVVVGAKSHATALNKEQASALFLGKSTQLNGAGIPLLIDQPESADVRQTFYNKVTEKTAIQVKAIWSRLVFSGKAALPKEVANSDEVKKALNSNPDAIGYIKKNEVDDSVKVLFAAD
jgi:ABC-type phosphate transport system substrate-binding protein